MEKLIELLNEYEKLNMCRTFIGYYKEEEEITGDIFSIKACELISKKFGFIKWLVENDKIDLEKEKKSDYYIEFTGALTKDKKSDLDITVDILLMQISISDNPIEFLISILK